VIARIARVINNESNRVDDSGLLAELGTPSFGRRDLLPTSRSIALFLIPFDSPHSLDILSRLV
jgi:hypothetical protein